MKILSDLQQNALDAFFSVSDLKKHFYLTGGTALSAFYLEHRLSEDLDFTHEVDIHTIERLVTDAFSQARLNPRLERSSPTFRRYRVSGKLRVDLVRDVDFRVGNPEMRERFMVDNVRNIAVNKVGAIYGRLDPKDYVDLYFLKPYLNYDIMELLGWAQKKDAGIEPFQWANVIADVDTITILPRMLKPLELRDLKRFFHAMRDESVDAIKPA